MGKRTFVRRFTQCTVP